MRLSSQRLVTLKAMLKQLSGPEIEAATYHPLAVVQAAARGEEIDRWVWDFIVDAIEAWDSKGEVKP